MSLFVTSDVMISDHYSIRMMNKNLTDKYTRFRWRENQHSCKLETASEVGQITRMSLPSVSKHRVII